MRKNAVYLIPGQDRRSRYIAMALTERGCHVENCAAADADVIILPIGVQAPPELLEELRPGQIVLGGLLGAGREKLMRCGVLAADYYEDVLLKHANAVPTAEGAIELLMQRLPVTIQGSHGLITGYGRIGCLLAHKLRLLGAKITASARRDEDIGRIHAAGFLTEHTGAYTLPLDAYDYVINTVPAPVFENTDYGNFRKDCLFIELASDPGGINEGECRRLGLAYLRAPGLPGRCAPKTAGYAIADAIERILNSEESSCDMKP